MSRQRDLTALWVLMVVSAVMMLAAGCGRMEGEVNPPRPPVVDFVDVPPDSSTFDYAPVIYWKGSDPDGFVEYYSYADITDSAAIVMDDKLEYVDQIPDEAWVDTISTSARVYLLTEADEVQSHIFYLRCVDNDGMVSPVKYRTFFRENNPPNVPVIGVTGSPDEEWDNAIYVADTLYSAADVSAVWPGIQFSWRGSDPDDKSLFRIPLEFQAVLVRSPNDTVFTSQWSDETSIVISDLRTGFYTLYIWSRDDGLTKSVGPARAEFNVIRPTFEHNILFVLELPNQPPFPAFPAPDSVRAFYDRLITDVKPELENADLDLDSTDVRFFTVTTLGNASTVVPKSLLHQYKLVIFASDQLQFRQFGENYLNRRDEVLLAYLQVGGRVWFMGRQVGSVVLNWNRVAPREDLATLMSDFFAVDDIVSPSAVFRQVGGQPYAFAEFIATVAGLPDFSSMSFDPGRAAENCFAYADTTVRDSTGALVDTTFHYGVTGVERIERRTGGAETTQYFLSRTENATGRVWAEDSRIIDRIQLDATNTADAHPTGTNCYIQTEFPKVTHVDSVINVTHRELGMNNAIGEVVHISNVLVSSGPISQVKISYNEGQPWDDDDSLSVYYSYDPVTDYNRKPVEVRFERVEVVGLAVSRLRFRTALSVFPYYFMEYDAAKENFRLMLDWFLNPTINF